jgi:hypothetical protein
MRVFISASLISVATIITQAAAQREPAKPLLVETSHLDTKGNINTENGQRTIELREIKATGMGEAYLVIVLFDPQTKTYSGRVITYPGGDRDGRLIETYLGHVAVFLKGTQFYQFTLQAVPLQIRVHHFGARAADLNDAAQRALLDVKPSDVLQSAGPAQNLDAVVLPELKHFEARLGSPIITEYPVVEAVTWDATEWKLVLKGQWREEVALDSRYTLLSMRKLE